MSLIKAPVVVKNRPKRKFSVQRRQLRIATAEGIPAIVFQTLLAGPFLTGFLLYLGASASQVGFVLAITTFVNIAQVAVAFLIQRLEKRKRIFVTFGIVQRLIWGATGLVPFLFDPSHWVTAFVVLYVAAFLANAVVTVLWTSIVSDLVPPAVRGRYFGMRNMIVNAVGSLTLFVGGIILDANPGGPGFLILYIVVWTCILINILVLLKFPDVPFERSAETKFFPMLRKPLHDASFIRATAFLSFFLLLQTIVVPLFSYVMLDILGLSYKTVSTMTVVQTLSMMASFYVWGNLNARYSSKQLLYWTLPIVAVSCLSWGLQAFLPVVAALVLAHMLLGAGIGGFNQLSFNFIIGDTPKRERPMFTAVYSASTGLMSFFGPLIGGRVYDWVEGGPHWIQAYGVQMTVGALLLVFSVTVGRRVLVGERKEASPLRRLIRRKEARA
ncbi:MFS transporter [Saccharibacillus alkalitolerans]|uniref:MFS transporter n=1 Tax=Saccharibacillus alkalitolerans TaxID=2705290 RepID=A0ABX0F8Y5_9BACL|nr:MFS transporter [Saccharibacillus alkalitolerans]NGZ77408.1 MFS transporter [Saccharibacillus alkalitolerans]